MGSQTRGALLLTIMMVGAPVAEPSLMSTMVRTPQEARRKEILAQLAEERARGGRGGVMGLSLWGGSGGSSSAGPDWPPPPPGESGAQLVEEELSSPPNPPASGRYESEAAREALLKGLLEEHRRSKASKARAEGEGEGGASEPTEVLGQGVGDGLGFAAESRRGRGDMGGDEARGEGPPVENVDESQRFEHLLLGEGKKLGSMGGGGMRVSCAVWGFGQRPLLCRSCMIPAGAAAIAWLPGREKGC